MKWSSLALSLLCSTTITLAATDTFYLTAENGDPQGPFEFKDGSTITIGSQTYTVSKVHTARQKVEELLEATLIPSLTLKDAHLQDAVDIINKTLTTSQASQPAWQTSSSNITLQLAILSDQQKTAAINCNVTNISVMAAMQACANVTKTKISIHGNRVQFIDPNTPDSPLVTRQYTIPNLDNACGRIASDTRSDGDADANIQQFFSNMGVSWPQGSSLKYMKSIGMLSVKNTDENLQLISMALEASDAMCYQIEIEVQFVEFDLADIAVVSQKGMTDVTALNLLRKQGKGKLLYAPKVVTKPGQEAQVKGVKEVIYPTQFCATPIILSNTATNSNISTNGTNSTTAIDVGPGNFETREVGVLLTVTPSVSPEGNMIDITMAPEIVTEPEWKDYGFTYMDLSGVERKGHMEEPFFFARKLSTSVSVNNGETVLIGGGLPERDLKKVTYVFLTARLIGTDGKPVKTNRH